ncbi:Rha family transcriptional regulator [Methylobacterium aquaticum]|uniref:Rha family transcriptional regulator n=1 Tax=Methylobacterium aquaticum TaxID=270351 RepID=UPI003D16F103
MAQQLLPSAGGMPVSMLTVEIAALTKKRHDHVMRDTRKMLVELHGPDDAPKFGAVYRDAKGEDRPCYRLPKREVMILVTGYSISLRAAVIDRLAELEAERAAALQAPVSSQSPTPIADRVTMFINALVPQLKKQVVSGVTGYVKKSVAQPLANLKANVGDFRHYVEQRFEASKERDILHIGKTEDVADAVAAAREDIREIKIFLNSKTPKGAGVEKVGDLVTIAEAQDIVGVPQDLRSRALSLSLSASAQKWFDGHGKIARPLAMNGKRTRCLFEREAVEAWWQAEGINVCDQFIARKRAA